MSAYLRRSGHGVEVCDSTSAAWDLAQTAPAGFHIVLLDGSMRGMSSLELATRLLRRDPAVRVVFASGSAVDTASLEAEAPGRTATLPKPFTPDMLGSLVRSLSGTEKEDI